MRTSPSFPHPSWLPVKARSTHSTLRISSTSTSQTALSLHSIVASSSRAQTEHPDRSQRTTRATKRSDERNTRSDPEAPSHLDQPHGTLALSPLAPASLKLLPIKYEEISLQTLRQSLSLRRLRIYWLVNTLLTTIELKVQVALSLLDGDACTWATPYFAQLMSVQIGAQGATTPFRNKAAFAAAFKARFGNLDDEVAAQVELAKLCADKSVRKKHTAAEFSTLFKGPADHSGYGDLELCDKYLSGIPSRMYRKIELETFTTWQAAEKHATEVEQILDIS
ncbi:predicted protein [Postia placenta Mad-698-R]|nr:predicted protein [Postia placenta Mad-698-R]